MQRVIGHPTLGELQQSGPLTTSPEDVLASLVEYDRRQWDMVQEEFGELERQLAKRKAAKSRSYPDNFEIERSTSLLLYGVTRLCRPSQIVETGVADGVSSFFFLSALRANGHGHLHSLDISDDVGGLVEDRRGWDLTVSEPAKVEETLAALLRQSSPVDIFFHDADHRYLPQTVEYETLRRSVDRPAILISDDVDLSYAFEMFCRRHGLSPSYLLDARKVAGAVRIHPGPRTGD
jgi:predicted O-methyltransferase YrrM